MEKIQTEKLSLLKSPNMRIRKDNLVVVNLLFTNKDHTQRTDDIFAKKLCVGRDTKTGLTAKQSIESINELLAINLEKNQVARIPVSFNENKSYGANTKTGFRIRKGISLEDAAEELGLEIDPERNFFEKGLKFNPLASMLNICQASDLSFAAQQYLAYTEKEVIKKNINHISAINNFLNKSNDEENNKFISGEDVFELAQIYAEIKRRNSKIFWKKTLGEKEYEAIVKKQNQPKQKENVFGIFEKDITY